MESTPVSLFLQTFTRIEQFNPKSRALFSVFGLISKAAGAQGALSRGKAVVPQFTSASTYRSISVLSFPAYLKIQNNYRLNKLTW